MSVKNQGKAIIMLPKSTHAIDGKGEEKGGANKSAQDALEGAKEVEPSKSAKTEKSKDQEAIQVIIQLLSVVHTDALNVTPIQWVISTQ